MQLPETWREAIEQWAARTASVREVWLFGSRAKGTAEPDSDVDIAIRLMPPTKGTDWAHGNYQRFGDDWQNELKAIVGRHVSLVLLPTDQDIGPRILLWTRE
jgi:predicted nucleotidyltransferase